MYEKTVGEFLEEVRKNKNLSVKAVCTGICNASTYGRYERDEIIPCRYTLNSLLERMGKNSLSISYICSEEEYNFERLRSNILYRLKESDLDAVSVLLKEYNEKITRRAKNLHSQYMKYVEAKMLLQKEEPLLAVQKFREAYSITKGKIRISEGEELFSLIEFELLYEICKYENNMDVWQQLHNYLESKEDDNILKLKYYGCITKSYCMLLMETNYLKARNVIEESLSYHKRMYIVNLVDELLECKMIIENANGINNKDEIEIIKALSVIKEESKDGCIINVPSNRKSNLIKKRRLEVGFTRERLSEGICDVTTLLRYENGELDPTDSKYIELMNRMNNDIKRYQLSYETGKITDVEEFRKWEEYFQKHKEDEIVEEIVKATKGQFIKESESKQFYDRFVLFKKYYCDEEICKEQYIAGLEEIVCRSIKEYQNGNFSINKLFSETEIYILNDIAIMYINVGKYQIAKNIYNRLQEYFKIDKVGVMEIAHYKIMINYSNLLGKIGEYQASYNVCCDLINAGMLNVQQKLIFNPLFNMGWNIMESRKTTEPIGTEKNARKFIKASALLCKYYNESEVALQVIVDYYHANFSDKMELYKG